MKTIKNLSLALLALIAVNTKLQADEDTPGFFKAVGTPFAVSADVVTGGEADATHDLYHGKDGDKHETIHERHVRERADRHAQTRDRFVAKSKSTSKAKAAKKSKMNEDSEENFDALS